jgi:hypothetical protein
LFGAFHALQQQSGTPFEDAVLTELHRNVVIDGDFDSAEEMLNQASERRLFDECISQYPYTPVWKRIYPAHDNESPCMRGGHQMCIDVEVNHKR